MSKVQRSRLGRGLSSLITLSELPVENEIQGDGQENLQPHHLPPPIVSRQQISENLASTAVSPDPGSKSTADHVFNVAIEAVRTNPHQPRKQLNDASIAELAASIKSTGIIQPIIVRRQGDGFELIAGERRWRAAKHAGLPAIPAIVRDVNAFEQAQMALVENIQREDLNPIDRASSYRTLIDQLGLTQAELASRLGEERSGIANYLRLLELAEPVRESVRAGDLSLGHAKLLAGVDDPAEQVRLANLVSSQELSVRNLERMIAETATIQSTPTRPIPAAPSAHLQDLERSIARQLGMRIQLRPTSKKGQGKLIVHYATLDEFDALLARLGVNADE